MLESLVHTCINNLDYFIFLANAVIFVFGLLTGLLFGYVWGANNYKK